MVSAPLLVGVVAIRELAAVPTEPFAATRSLALPVAGLVTVGLLVFARQRYGNGTILSRLNDVLVAVSNAGPITKLSVAAIPALAGAILGILDPRQVLLVSFPILGAVLVVNRPFSTWLDE